MKDYTEHRPQTEGYLKDKSQTEESKNEPVSSDTCENRPRPQNPFAVYFNKERMEFVMKYVYLLEDAKCCADLQQFGISISGKKIGLDSGVEVWNFVLYNRYTKEEISACAPVNCKLPGRLLPWKYDYGAFLNGKKMQVGKLRYLFLFRNMARLVLKGRKR